MMKKLKDYSGQFLPGLKPADFSADALRGMLKLYSKLYSAADGFWYLTVKERLGNDEAIACDIRAWEQLSKYEMANITRHFNIPGKDITALMKAMQLTPWLLNNEYSIELEGRNAATLTVTRCTILDALEKEGKGREAQICPTVTPIILKGYASFFNPAIEIKNLKIPPRKSKEEICCRWRFTLAG